MYLQRKYTACLYLFTSGCLRRMSLCISRNFLYLRNTVQVSTPTVICKNDLLRVSYAGDNFHAYVYHSWMGLIKYYFVVNVLHKNKCIDGIVKEE